MRKASIFVLALAASSLFYSCKKTYTCECKHKGNGGIGTTYTMTAYKKHATEACAETGKNFADSTCALK